MGRDLDHVLLFDVTLGANADDVRRLEPHGHVGGSMLETGVGRVHGVSKLHRNRQWHARGEETLPLRH